MSSSLAMKSFGGSSVQFGHSAFFIAVATTSIGDGSGA
jgi:hypothetical protein